MSTPEDEMGPWKNLACTKALRMQNELSSFPKEVELSVLSGLCPMGGI
jgi:hypothetical protein